jgi:hypothetical protein
MINTIESIALYAKIGNILNIKNNNDALTAIQSRLNILIGGEFFKSGISISRNVLSIDAGVE